MSMLNTTLIKMWLPALLTLALTGCGRDGWLDRDLNASEPVVVEGALIYALEGQAAVAVVDPSDEVHWLPIGFEPRVMASAPDRAGVMLLDGEGHALWLAIDDGAVAATLHYDLGTAFDAVTFAPDGARAILHHAPDDQRLDGLARPIIRNPGEIALLDIGRPQSAEHPMTRVLEATGAAPRGFFVEPVRTLGGIERQLAWTLADRMLLVLDLAAPDAQARRVPLVPDGAVDPVTPEQVVYGEVEGRALAVIRAQQSDRLFALTFDEAPRDVVPRPFVQLLSSGPSPEDMALAQLPEGLRVLSVHRSDDTLALIEPISGRRVRIEVEASVDHIELLTEADGVARRAILWQPGSPVLVSVDLDRLEGRRGQALAPIGLAQPVQALHPIPGRPRAVAHLGGGQLVVLDLVQGTASPIEVEGGVRQVVVDAERGRIFASVGETAAGVVSIDVDDLRLQGAPVPGGGGGLHYLPGRDRIVIDHQDPLGRISSVRGAALGASPFVERVGLWLTQAFDEEVAR